MEVTADHIDVQPDFDDGDIPRYSNNRLVNQISSKDRLMEMRW